MKDMPSESLTSRKGAVPLKVDEWGKEDRVESQYAMTDIQEERNTYSTNRMQNTRRRERKNSQKL